MTTSKILVPIDGSPSSLKAAELASDWASRMGCVVTLLHVYDPKQKPKEEIFDLAEKFFTLKGLKVRRRVQPGIPAEEICSTAKAGSYDLIIMGSRGLTEFKKLFVGSVSSKVAAQSNCPVTIVH